MKSRKVSTIGKKFESKLRDLELIILQSEIRQFGTWLYGKKHEEEEKGEWN